MLSIVRLLVGTNHTVFHPGELWLVAKEDKHSTSNLKVLQILLLAMFLPSLDLRRDELKEPHFLVLRLTHSVAMV